CHRPSGSAGILACMLWSISLAGSPQARWAALPGAICRRRAGNAERERRFPGTRPGRACQLDSTIKLDIRYATSNNFLGRPVYKEGRAFLQRPAAEALTRANRRLREKGYGLLVFDGYRPWSVTKMFWDSTPQDKKQFVADPSQGSRHNRGCAVDLTLYELRSGKEVEMPSGYDEMTDHAYPNYSGGTPEQRRLREMLREAME